MITLPAIIAVSFLVSGGPAQEIVTKGQVMEIQLERINIGGEWYEYAIGTGSDIQQVFEGLPPVDQIRVPFRAEIVFRLADGESQAKVVKVRPAPLPGENPELIGGDSNSPNF